MKHIKIRVTVEEDDRDWIIQLIRVLGGGDGIAIHIGAIIVSASFIAMLAAGDYPLQSILAIIAILLIGTAMNKYLNILTVRRYSRGQLPPDCIIGSWFDQWSKQYDDED